MWPEVTDPEKFVYEDVAIAAYLLVRMYMTIRGCVEWGNVAPGRWTVVNNTYQVLS